LRPPQNQQSINVTSHDFPSTSNSSSSSSVVATSSEQQQQQASTQREIHPLMIDYLDGFLIFLPLLLRFNESDGQ